jgi:hypothetical protein
MSVFTTTLLKKLGQFIGKELGSEPLKEEGGPLAEIEDKVLEAVLPKEQRWVHEVPQSVNKTLGSLVREKGFGSDLGLKGTILGFDIGDAEGPDGYRVIPNPARFMPNLSKYWETAKDMALAQVNTQEMGSVGDETAGANYSDFVTSPTTFDLSGIKSAIATAARFTADAAQTALEASKPYAAKAYEVTADAAEVAYDATTEAAGVAYEAAKPYAKSAYETALEAGKTAGEAVVDAGTAVGEAALYAGTEAAYAAGRGAKAVAHSAIEGTFNAVRGGIVAGYLVNEVARKAIDSTQVFIKPMDIDALQNEEVTNGSTNTTISTGTTDPGAPTGSTAVTATSITATTPAPTAARTSSSPAGWYSAESA